MDVMQTLPYMNMFGGYSDQIVFKEIFDAIKNYTKSPEFTLYFFLQILLCGINIGLIIAIKYLISNPSTLKEYLVDFLTSTINYFKIIDEYPSNEIKNRLLVKLLINNKEIYKKFISQDTFSYSFRKYFLSIEIIKVNHTIKVIYYCIHKKHLQNSKKGIKDLYEKHLQKQLNVKEEIDTICLTTQSLNEKTFNFIKYHPQNMYETSWYKNLFNSIFKHIFISKESDYFSPLAILIDSEPGLGKTKFLDYLGRAS